MQYLKDVIYENSRDVYVIKLYSQCSMRIFSLRPPLPSLLRRLQAVLQECSSSTDDLTKVRQVHAQAVVGGISGISSLQNKLLGLYVLCRSFSDATNLFFRMEKIVPLPWNWMIRGFSLKEDFESVFLMYSKMWVSGVLPDKFTFTYVVKACSGISSMDLGRSIHQCIRILGFEMDLFIGSALIKMYTGFGLIHDAREVFDKMPDKDSILWNVMIDGYMKCRCVEAAIHIFKKMRQSESNLSYVSVVSVLSICSSEAMLESGRQLHGLAVKYGVEAQSAVANTLLALYSKCRHWSDMNNLLQLMPRVELIAWNGLISGYVQNGLMEQALNSFFNMQTSGIKPDSITLTCLLPAFSSVPAAVSLDHGKEIQAYALRNSVELDSFLQTALIDIYFKCRDVEMARKVFDGITKVDVVICSAMISGYVLNGMTCNALAVFRMFLQTQLKPNAVMIASVLPACSSLADRRLGQEVHGFAVKNEFESTCYVASALSDMYSKCGRLDLGYKFFTKTANRDVVAWNSMISSFVQNSRPEEAIRLFRKMGIEEGLVHDTVSISSILSACGSIPTLNHGKEIHGFMIRRPTHLMLDLFAQSALIDMYGKCGCLDSARKVFDSMDTKNDVSWNSIIAAYGIHGHLKAANDLFGRMKKEGFQPDDLTFLAMLSTCAHAGNLKQGFKYFNDMRQPRAVHYACMVDMLGRAGHLQDAFNLINSMPMEADAGIWGALLGACRVHNDAELAELASKHLFELDPANSGYYVLLSNVRAGSGQWEAAGNVRKLMKERNVFRLPGCSWIDLNNVSHVFVADDLTSHSQFHQIYLCLLILHSALL